MIENLYNILSTLKTQENNLFSGVGLLICDNTDNLPISSLHNSSFVTSGQDLAKQLIELSNYNNRYHDGFHILSTNLEITHVAQYFYPKPPKEHIHSSAENYGVRYFVAKIGSTLPDVKYSAIVNSNYEIYIFQDGKRLKVQTSANT